ncbi:hypothetical protein N7532_005538 [Penicillium argentinense]|uniref:Uncharacterized protein n=1 Tax=Penicillium argentinense TaxID=1131581 RepID=A0A9W9KAZ8_9EURO|nr:uncharacterized protein N7532_005538 [Penicillium argentinense]KAJ5098537.1 hypothetical protein N7532_005538 [Penicillium argentinense]
MSGEAKLGYAPPAKGLGAILPYARFAYIELALLNKPHCIYMVYYPHVVGLAYASSISSSPMSPETIANRIVNLLVWTVLMRSAICAWNDNINQHYDRQTARC